MAPDAKLAGVSAPSPEIGRKSGIARFGVFEADLAARELRKQGRRIRLQYPERGERNVARGKRSAALGKTGRDVYFLPREWRQDKR